MVKTTSLWGQVEGQVLFFGSIFITRILTLLDMVEFERFLNPERVSMPDFDIDFCQQGRDKVIDYARKIWWDQFLKL